MGYGVWGMGYGVWGMGCRVWGAGCGVQGVGCRVWGMGRVLTHTHYPTPYFELPTLHCSLTWAKIIEEMRSNLPTER